MAVYAIGDIHGCLGTLEALLDRIGPGADDHLVFVGDYIDRGPDSRGVLARMIALRDAAASGAGPACTFIRGNHDQMLLDWVDEVPGAFDLWRPNGGLTTLDSYPEGRVLPEHVAFLRETELAVIVGGAAYVHAGLDPARPVREQVERPDPEVALWTRAHLRADLSRWEMPVVCGHTPVLEPLATRALVAIDTGAVYHHREGLGRLTAARMPEAEFVQVPYQG